MTREEALKIAKNWVKTEQEKEVLEALVPELAESENERIRKQILDCFGTMRQQGCFPSKHKEQYDSWISRLEKQKEQKPKTMVRIPKFRVGDIIQHVPLEEWDRSRRITSIDKGGYYCDTKHLGDNFSGCFIGFSFEDEYELVERKPAEWSEEDEEIISSIVDDLKRLKKKFTGLTGEHAYEVKINWLKSLRPQPQRRDTYYDIIHSILDMLKDRDFTQITPEHRVSLLNDIRVKCKIADECAEILDKPSWKPSGKQMEALNIAISEFDGYRGDEELKSLYNDLKKLI